MKAKFLMFGFRLPNSILRQTKTSHFLLSNMLYLAVVNNIPVYKRLVAIAAYSVFFSHHKVLCLVTTGSFILNLIALLISVGADDKIFEPRHEKTNVLVSDLV